MSQENVEVVRRMLNAFNSGDFEASLAFLDEEVEWHDPPDVPGAAVHRGPEEVRSWFARWLGAWEVYTAEAEELIDAGDHVVVVHHEWGRGKGSGIEVEKPKRQPLRPARRESGPPAAVPRPRPGPRSRGAVGVGDVAGERGSRSAVD